MRRLSFKPLPLLSLMLSALPIMPSALHAENKLKGQPSSYLRQYSEDKINWRPWESATFTEATKRDKIIVGVVDNLNPYKIGL